jgi:hypothetical protein
MELLMQALTKTTDSAIAEFEITRIVSTRLPEWVCWDCYQLLKLLIYIYLHLGGLV